MKGKKVKVCPECGTEAKGETLCSECGFVLGARKFFVILLELIYLDLFAAMIWGIIEERLAYFMIPVALLCLFVFVFTTAYYIKPLRKRYKVVRTIGGTLWRLMPIGY